MKARLGINIDHVATLRQARGENYPSVAKAAKTVIKAGAEQITIHLREDRRHIQDYDVSDVREVTKKFDIPLNLEMGAADEIIGKAILFSPDWICLVPEKREEQTTEGGLNLLDEEIFIRIENACRKLKIGIPNLKISLFVEGKPEILDKCCDLANKVLENDLRLIDAVEIHTGDYARYFNDHKSIQVFIDEFIEGKEIIKKYKLGYHAGHGLTCESLLPLVESGLFEEYNIGHWVVSQAVFDGLGLVVHQLQETFSKHSVN